MRQYYASDKKRREEAKRKQQAEKRLRKQNKSKNAATPTESEPGTVTATGDTEAPPRPPER